MGIIDRRTQEQRERDTLAPYAAFSADTHGRQHPEPEHDYRTAYQRDRDRIVHSSAFRRLEYKTQVFVNHEGDHYRTRLTHTIEVAQISRTIARSLDLNEDLVEAIALAHDVGHTPFGHTGEEALRELMADEGGFEHNQQGLRVVDVLERYSPDWPGLNLTFEVRESIAKHKTRWDEPTLSAFGDAHPVLEAQVVEAADSIAYDSHDLDDGLRAGILVGSDLRQLPLWREAETAVSERWPDLDTHFSRRQMIRYLINRAVCDLIDTTRARIADRNIRSVDDVKNHKEPLVGFSDAFRGRKCELEDYLFDALYRDWRVVRMMNKAKRFIVRLFNAYVDVPEQLTPFHQACVKQVGLKRAVCDYIAGMTDRYANEQYVQLFQP